MSDTIYQKILDEWQHKDETKKRQELIKKIQSITGRKLICYTSANFPINIQDIHMLRMIRPEDVQPFEDLLISAGADKADLMISSNGGDPNAAEKLLMMCRSRFKKGFNVIVPNHAKSAATMIALGSDKILMGYLSELGPIDPQIVAGGISVPAQSFIGGLEDIRKRLKSKTDPDPVNMYFPILSNIRPEVIQMCENAIAHSRIFAEKWLSSYMFKKKPKQAKLVAKVLSEGKVYKSHGKVIDFKEAKDVLKLNVDIIPENSDLWRYVWELYNRQMNFLQSVNGLKLYETDSVSFTINVNIGINQPPAQ